MDWILNNFWPTLSSLLTGAALTVTLQILFKFIFKVRIETKIKDFFSYNHIHFNLLNNWFNNKKVAEKKQKIPVQSTENDIPKSPLNTNQKSICQDISKITRKYSSDTLDLTELYEEASREHYSKNIALASKKYFQLFNTILLKITSYPQFKSANAKTNLNKFRYLVNGLSGMLQVSTDNSILIKQYSDCEEAILNVLANIPYESN